MGSATLSPKTQNAAPDWLHNNYLCISSLVLVERFAREREGEFKKLGVVASCTDLR
jgi:hypothetical protein